MTTHEKTKAFVDRERLYDMVEGKTPSDARAFPIPDRR